MRCSICGHESPPGSSFCLNCGSALAPAAPPPGLTPGMAAGLPVICPLCRGENPPGMKFCRSCGNALAGTSPSAPAYGAAIPQSAIATPVPSGMPPGMAMPPPGAIATMVPSTSVMAQNAPAAAPPPMTAGPRGMGSTMTCPRCGTATPVGFAYCQQCGLHMQPIAPTDPGNAAAPRPRTPSSAPLQAPPVPPPAVIVQNAPNPNMLGAPPIDPQAATMAQPDAGRPIPGVGARPSANAWGSAVLVNRDGSDGQRFALSSEDIVLGRSGADIVFDEDRFLAKQHARLARGADGAVKLHPIDTLNGVFKKADAPVELADGATILVGREVLRYERVAPEERTVHPLIRHGVALFGSPPRDPWGRLHQIVPSGGHRDVRHLIGEEIVLGREEGDIVFRDDAFMSRRHAALNWNGSRAQLTDLGSSNGTFVRVVAPITLKHGDHIRLGDQLLRIELGR
jgi:hypothetical protein